MTFEMGDLDFSEVDLDVQVVQLDGALVEDLITVMQVCADYRDTLVEKHKFSTESAEAMATDLHAGIIARYFTSGDFVAPDPESDT